MIRRTLRLGELFVTSIGEVFEVLGVHVSREDTRYDCDYVGAIIPGVAGGLRSRLHSNGDRERVHALGQVDVASVLPVRSGHK